jgi:hypothetical protein
MTHLLTFDEYSNHHQQHCCLRLFGDTVGKFLHVESGTSKKPIIWIVGEVYAFLPQLRDHFAYHSWSLSLKTFKGRIYA